MFNSIVPPKWLESKVKTYLCKEPAKEEIGLFLEIKFLDKVSKAKFFTMNTLLIFVLTPSAETEGGLSGCPLQMPFYTSDFD